MSRWTGYIIGFIGGVIAIGITVWTTNLNSEAEETSTSNTWHDDGDWSDATPKKELVSEEEFNGYGDNDAVSYWYMRYETRKVRGWTVMKVNGPYFDMLEVITTLREELNYHGDKYIELNFFQRVPYETYKSYIDNVDKGVF